MKLAICLLLACLLTASQQQPQFMRQPRWPGYSYWQSPFYPGWSYNYHQAPFLSDHNRFFEDKATPSGFFEAKEQDIEARVKGGYKEEKLNENSDNKPETRLLNSFGFVSNPYNYNPFLKTLYQFTSATATVCSVTTCIPAAQFADAAAQASICAGRRRREDRAVLEWFDAAGETSINSSPVERLIQTALPELDFERKSRGLVSENQVAQERIESSKGVDLSFDVPLRAKRNLFFFTSTITTYSFTTMTITSKLVQGADQALTCRPSNIGIC